MSELMYKVIADTDYRGTEKTKRKIYEVYEDGWVENIKIIDEDGNVELEKSLEKEMFTDLESEGRRHPIAFHHYLDTVYFPDTDIETIFNC